MGLIGLPKLPTYHSRVTRPGNFLFLSRLRKSTVTASLIG